jgi:hypothetical protein
LASTYRQNIYPSSRMDLRAKSGEIAWSFALDHTLRPQGLGSQASHLSP